MALFEFPQGLNPDMHHALTTLQRCCEMVREWGTWHDVPFAAANFTTLATATGTWTVVHANVKTLKYQVIHNTMTVAFEIIQSSVAGPISGLLIKLPLPYQCLPRPVGAPGFADSGILFTNACMIRQDLGLHRLGTVSLVNEPAGDLVLLIQLPNGENINVVGEAGALGQITFEVRHA